MVNSSELSQKNEFIAFSKLLRVAAALSFFIIIFGSLVRAASAGLACPDWPLCFGELVPTFDTGIFLEWFHRLLAGGLTLLMCGAFFRLAKSNVLRKSLGLQIVTTLVLLSIQVVLGGLTVLKLLDAKTVAAHLINALLFLTVLIWTTMRSRKIGTNLGALEGTDEKGKVSKNSLGWLSKEQLKEVMTFRWALLSLTVGVFLQLALGGMVSTNYAGLACADFPTCQGEWFPPAFFHLWLQMGHRALGFFVLGMAIWVFVWGRRVLLPVVRRSIASQTRGDDRRILRWIWIAVHALPVLLAVQIGLGILNVVYLLPTAITVLHLANAVALYVLVLTATIGLFEPAFVAGWQRQSLDGAGAKSKADVSVVRQNHGTVHQPLPGSKQRSPQSGYHPS